MFTFLKKNIVLLLAFFVILSPYIANAGTQGSACNTDADCRPEDEPESDLGVCGTDFTCYIVCSRDDDCGGGVCRTIGEYLGFCARTQTKGETTKTTKSSPEKFPEIETITPETETITPETETTKPSPAAIDKQACLSKGAQAERGLLTEGLSNECVGCGECSQCDILMVIKNIVQFILKIVGPLAILAIILGGFLYVTSGGSEERAQMAKGAITAVIVGFVIVLVAWVLVNFIIQILTGGSQNIFEAAWYSPRCE